MRSASGMAPALFLTSRAGWTVVSGVPFLCRRRRPLFGLERSFLAVTEQTRFTFGSMVRKTNSITQSLLPGKLLVGILNGTLASTSFFCPPLANPHVSSMNSALDRPGAVLLHCKMLEKNDAEALVCLQGNGSCDRSAFARGFVCSLVLSGVISEGSGDQGFSARLASLRQGSTMGSLARFFHRGLEVVTAIIFS